MSESPIVIVGSLEDTHARTVHDRLRERGHEPFVLDAQQYPEELSLALGDALEDIVIAGRRLARPAAVYLRSLYQTPAAYGVDAEDAMRENWRRTLMAFRERATPLSALMLRWERLGVPIYNPTRVGLNITKPFQLSLLAAAGLPVPKTLWTNDPEAVRRFCGEHEAIYKPVAGGAATRKVEARDLEDERLEKLRAAPVCFQELLPGDDVRVYVIDDRMVCALRIETEAIDFRQNEQKIEPIELPEPVAKMCIHAAEVIGLRYTGMDIKADGAGNYKILELNPSAMFVGFEQRAGVDIGGPLCDALLHHSSHREP